MDLRRLFQSELPFLSAIICVDTPVTEVNVITNSQTALQRQIEARATAYRPSQVSTDIT